MKYTAVEKAYILSKVKGIKWDEISESLRKFWIDWRNYEKKW